MLPQKKRLLRKHFRLSCSQRRSLQTPHLSMRVVSLPISSEPSRFAFIVSKKIARLAVDRNKLRRRGYSVIEKKIHKMVPGKGVMFHYRKGSLPYTYKEFETEVNTLLHEAKIFTDDKKNTH